MNQARPGLVSVGLLSLLLAVLPGISVFYSLAPVMADSTVNVNIPNGASTNQNGPGYSPATITVVIGVNATVMWTNADIAAHTVTGDNSSSINSGNLAPNQSYSFTFTSPGTYPYHCNYHNWMHGTVIVRSGAVPEFPISALAVIFFGVIAVAAMASGRFRTRSSTFHGTQQPK
jgi:plastocyanin